MERRRRSQKLLIIGGTFVVGLVVGILVGLEEADTLFASDGLFRSDGWPPAMAIGIACSYLAAVVGGGIALARHTDEVERMTQYKATAFAALVYILVYPIWFTLWMGDLVREPLHGPIFLLFWVSLVVASIFYRNR